MTQSNDPSHAQGNQGPGAAPSNAASIVPVIVEKKRSSVLGLLLGLAFIVAVGGVAFAVGRVTAPASAATTGGGGNGFGGNAPGASGAPGFGGGANAIGNASLTLSGTVEAVSSTSISVKTDAGATTEVPIDGSTTYHGQTSASASSISVGDTVRVQISGFGGAGAGQPRPSGGGAPSPGASGGLGQFGPAKDITVVSTP